MRVHITYIQGAFLREYEKSHLPLICDELQKYHETTDLVVEKDPSLADLIVMLPSAQYKTREYIKVLENDPLIRNHPDRIYVIDYDDHPEGMLPGLYTSIEAPFWSPHIHVSWPLLFMNNPLVYDLTARDIFDVEASRLFSFIGAKSHSIRGKIFCDFSAPSKNYHVEQIKKWYNHDEADRKRFLSVTLDSLFCLCPRGYASYTNRIPEVMAMGRVPVVIADDWVPFTFKENIPYYLRVPESELEHLPEILNNRRGEAREIGRNARILWEKYCSRPRRMVAALESIVTLAASQGERLTFASLREVWHSKAFQEKCGWTTRQRLALRAEQRLRRWFPRMKFPGVSTLMRYRNPSSTVK